MSNTTAKLAMAMPRHASVHYNELILQFEMAVQEVVQRSFPRYWDENSITNSILLELTEHTAQECDVQGLQRPMYVRWDAYKQIGLDEQQRGDIAVIVQVRHWTGTVLEGVGYLEAKRRYHPSGRYQALKPAQLKRIQKYAPLAQVLLYDYTGTTETTDNITVNHRFLSDHHWRSVFGTPHAVAVPISSVIASDLSDATLASLGLPIGHQLVARFFRGFDLDYSKDLVSSVKHQLTTFDDARTKIPRPAFVVVAQVAPAVEEVVPEFVAVHPDRFQRIAPSVG